MTIIEAMSKTDALIHNTYAQEDKLQWLSSLDRKVKMQILDTHQGAENVTFTGYDADTDLHTELLVPAPYDEVYLRWLEAQIHYHNDEMERYNAAIVLYNTAYEAYARYYNRTHMPLGAGNRFKF